MEPVSPSHGYRSNVIRVCVPGYGASRLFVARIKETCRLLAVYVLVTFLFRVWDSCRLLIMYGLKELSFFIISFV